MTIYIWCIAALYFLSSLLLYKQESSIASLILTNGIMAPVFLRALGYI